MNVAELFATLGIKPNEAEWARAKKKIDDFDKQTSSKFQRLKNNISKGFGLVGAQAITNVAGRIGRGLFDAGKDALNFNEQLTRLDIASRGAMGSMEQVQDRILAVSKATGVAKEELLAGAASFISITGDGKAASQTLETFARVAKASGASMGDISKSAAAMTQNLKIAPEDFEKAFSILIAGGKAGAIELRDVAGLMAQIAPLAERFEGGSGTTGLADLNAALQLTRQGAGSAGEAATQLSALMGAVVKNASRLEKSGVKVFNVDAETGAKTLRSFQEVIEAIGNSELAKDPTKLIKALGRKEAEAAFIQLTKVDGAWKSLADSSRDANDVAEDYDKFQRSSAAKVQKAWNNIKTAIAEAFTPERVDAMATALAGVLGFATDIVDKFQALQGFIDRITGNDQDEELGRTLARGSQKTEARVKQIMKERGVNEGRARAIEEGERTGQVRAPGEVGANLDAFRGLGTNDPFGQVSPGGGGLFASAPGSPVDRALDVVGLGNRNQPLVPEHSLSNAARQSGPMGISGIAPSLTLNMNIEARNADARETAEMVRSKIVEFWDTKVREMGQ
jgi:TP901 family phage tail tape measure protein